MVRSSTRRAHVTLLAPGIRILGSRRSQLEAPQWEGTEDVHAGLSAPLDRTRKRLVTV
jgi:hypothetical protein